MTTLASVSTSSAAPTYGNAQVQRSPFVRRHHDSDGDDDASKAERRDGPGRRNPLVAAMMSALSSLVPASSSTPSSGTPAATTAADAPATPPATTPTPTATTTASDPATTLRDAAYAFAHALYSALRGGGDDGGERRSHGHHHHHGHRGGGYGDLAERLNALATRLEAGSGTQTPTTPTTPVPPTDSASPPVADPVPVVQTPAPEPEPAAAASGNINITINVNINIGAAPATNATPAAQSSSNPLVDAFRKLLTALGADSGNTASPTERLTAFLRQMAESLSGDKSTTPAAPTSGSLLNVSA